MDAFFYAFVQSKCIFAGNSTAPAELRKRYELIVKKLRKAPVTSGNLTVDYTTFHGLLGTTLHQGEYAPALAGLLYELETGELGQAATFAQGFRSITTGPLTNEFGVQVAGICANERRHLRNAKELLSYFKDLKSKVPSVAAIFADFRLACVEWRIDPVSTLTDRIKKTKVAGSLLINGMFIS